MVDDDALRLGPYTSLFSICLPRSFPYIASYIWIAQSTTFLSLPLRRRPSWLLQLPLVAYFLLDLKRLTTEFQ